VSDEEKLTQPTAHPRILVVDDDARVRAMLVRALEDRYAVIGVGTAAEARAHLRQDPPALLILDVRLGNDDGLTLLEEFRRRHLAPVLLITGHGSEAVAARALELRANAYLPKPFGAPVLRTRVARLLAEGVRPDHLAERAREHIETLVETAVSAEDIAAQLRVPPALLLRVFRERFGQTPIAYLREARLRRAQELLLTTDLPIATVAVRAGFRDAQYLDRVFKRRFAMTPHAFRRAYLPSAPPEGPSEDPGSSR
jgi:DNA-binding response OmpR family regulator